MQIWPQGDGSVTELKSHFLINHVKSLFCCLLNNQRIYLPSVVHHKDTVCDWETGWVEKISTGRRNGIQVRGCGFDEQRRNTGYVHTFPCYLIGSKSNLL